MSRPIHPAAVKAREQTAGFRERLHSWRGPRRDRNRSGGQVAPTLTSMWPGRFEEREPWQIAERLGHVRWGEAVNLRQTLEADARRPGGCAARSRRQQGSGNHDWMIGGIAAPAEIGWG